MNVSGTATLAVEPDEAFAALHDPAVLAATIPGCRRLEALGEDCYAMTVAAGVGSIKGTYDGRVRLTDAVAPTSFRMHAEGAGAPGTIAADVEVTLAAVPGGTGLTYEADAVVGGMIGGVGQRMLTGVARRLADEFFGNVDAALAGTGTGTDGRPGQPTAIVDGPGPPGRHEPGRSGYLVGVATGAGAALAGVVVGAWIAGRRA